jgi:hypothetical protein
MTRLHEHGLVRFAEHVRRPDDLAEPHLRLLDVLSRWQWRATGAGAGEGAPVAARHRGCVFVRAPAA